jgi:hypothetical protein
MPLLELDEDALKIIAVKVCSVHSEEAKKGMHSAMRLLMPSLCLRQTNHFLPHPGPHRRRGRVVPGPRDDRQAQCQHDEDRDAAGTGHP